MITAHWASLLIVDNCGFPIWPAPIMISQNFLMLALFGDFYRKSYMQPAKTKSDDGNNNGNKTNELRNAKSNKSSRISSGSTSSRKNPDVDVNSNAVLNGTKSVTKQR